MGFATDISYRIHAGFVPSGSNFPQSFLELLLCLSKGRHCRPAFTADLPPEEGLLEVGESFRALEVQADCSVAVPAGHKNRRTGG